MLLSVCMRGQVRTLQGACREFVLEHLDKLEGTPACNSLMDDKDFMMRMLKALQASEQENKRRCTIWHTWPRVSAAQLRPACNHLMGNT